MLAVKNGDLPIIIVNRSDQMVILGGGSVVWVVSDVADSNIATPVFR